MLVCTCAVTVKLVSTNIDILDAHKLVFETDQMYHNPDPVTVPGGVKTSGITDPVKLVIYYVSL